MIAYETTLHKRQNDTEINNIRTLDHHTAFNNEHSPYQIVRYKRHRNDNVKQLKQENSRPYLCTKNLKKTNM